MTFDIFSDVLRGIGNFIVDFCSLTCYNIEYDYPFSTPTKNAVNKRIIERHTPRTLSSV